jgi:hypothetical protein
MKARFYTLVFVLNLSAICAQAQTLSECDWLLAGQTTGGGQLVACTTFDSSNAKIKLLPDTTLPKQSWQVGLLSKPNFTGTGFALQTDTLQPYAILDSSATMVYLDSNMTLQDMSFTFTHQFNTDSNADFCILQASADSGKNWTTDLASVFGLPLHYKGSLDLSGQDGFQGPFIWSGNSNGWQTESFCFVVFSIKSAQVPRSFAYRFLFVSDSVQTNKPGWAIGKICTGLKKVVAGISDETTQIQCSVSPNPCLDRKINISSTATLDACSFKLTNVFGQVVDDRALRGSQIQLQPSLPSGVYTYHLCNKQGVVIAQGKLQLQ